MGTCSVAQCRWTAAHHATFVLQITFILACAMHRARRDQLTNTRARRINQLRKCAHPVCDRLRRFPPHRASPCSAGDSSSAERRAPRTHTWQRPADEEDLAASRLRRSRMSPITSTTVSEIKMTNPRQAAVVSATVHPSSRSGRSFLVTAIPINAASLQNDRPRRSVLDRVPGT